MYTSHRSLCTDGDDPPRRAVTAVDVYNINVRVGINRGSKEERRTDRQTYGESETDCRNGRRPAN